MQYLYSLLTPSWEAYWFAASQEIPRISRNPKVHYRTHKHPPPVSIPGQPNPVHIPTSHLLEIHPNIIHPSMSRSLQWSPSLRFPQQDPIHPLSSPTIFITITNLKLNSDKYRRNSVIWGLTFKKASSQKLAFIWVRNFKTLVDFTT